MIEVQRFQILDIGNSLECLGTHFAIPEILETDFNQPGLERMRVCDFLYKTSFSGGQTITAIQII